VGNDLTLPDPAPDAPAGVSASDGTSTANVTVSWTAATYATGYGVYRYNLGQFRLGVAGRKRVGDELQRRDGHARHALLLLGQSDEQHGVERVQRVGHRLSADLHADGECGRRRLQRERAAHVVDVDGATGYRVYRYTSDTLFFASLIGTASATSYSDTAAVPGILYYYWIKATNSLCASAFSASDSGYRALAAPTGVTASESEADEVTVTWTAVTAPRITASIARRRPRATRPPSAVGRPHSPIPIPRR
jgi:hypothetical protein